MHVEEEKWANVVSPTETRKENSKCLDEEDFDITEEKEIDEKDSQLNRSSAHQPLEVSFLDTFKPLKITKPHHNLQVQIVKL